jgi:hypothetical protein
MQVHLMIDLFLLMALLSCWFQHLCTLNLYIFNYALPHLPENLGLNFLTEMLSCVHLLMMLLCRFSLFFSGTLWKRCLPSPGSSAVLRAHVYEYQIWRWAADSCSHNWWDSVHHRKKLSSESNQLKKSPLWHLSSS